MRTAYLLALTVLVTGATVRARAQDVVMARADTRPTITVSGSGEVSAAPDRAVVRLGAEAQANEAAGAQAQVNDIVQQALQQIRAVGIEERKIQTTGVSLYPVYEPQQFKPNEVPAAPRVAGYRASNVIQVEVNNLALVGKVIDAGVKAGANRIEGVSFDLQNDLPARTEALKQAVAEARAKAATMAAALDVKLAGVAEGIEGGVNTIPPMPRLGVMAARVEAPGTPVQPGEMRIQAAVTLRYHIVEK